MEPFEGSPYRVGNVLKVRLPRDDHCLEVKVLRIFEPFTLSAVIVIKFLEDPPPAFELSKDDIAVLKVYDRRFAMGQRDDWELGEHNEELENAYVRDLIYNPPKPDWDIAQAFRETPDDDSDDDDDDGDETERGAPERSKSAAGKEDDEEREESASGRAERAAEESDDGSESAGEARWSRFTSNVRLRMTQYQMLELATNEEDVYADLKPLQLSGQVPQYLGPVELLDINTKVVMDYETLRYSLSDSLTEEDREQINRYQRLPGCLITFVEGFGLRDLPQHAPESEWKEAVKAATTAINALHDYPIMHGDIRIDNIILQKTCNVDGTNSYKGVCIDFANGYNRGDETDEEWAERKLTLDEEGAIGKVMYHKLGLGKFEGAKEGTRRWEDFVDGIGIGENLEHGGIVR